MSTPSDLEDQIVASIRRIIRAIDLHSRRLQDRHKLTGPQLATLREAERQGEVPISVLARAVHLSQPTVSGILTRLERQGLVARRRSSGDRRTVAIDITAEGRQVLDEAPSLLQDRFRAELARLRDWERLSLLSALERIASMMDAEGIDAAPFLDLDTAGIGQPADSGEDDEEADAGLVPSDPADRA